MIVRPLVLLVFVASMLVAPSNVAAESAAVIPPLVGAGIARNEVQAALSEWLATHDRRAIALDPQLTRELEPCLSVSETTPPACAYQYLKRSNSDQAVVAWVEQGRATVAILVDDGLYYAGNARDADWRTALLQALNDARRRETRGLGPWLELSGFPGEAKVLVDGQDVGRLRGPPIRVSQGSHQLEIRADGYESRYELVPLPTATSYAALQIELETNATGLAATNKGSGDLELPGEERTDSPTARRRWLKPTLFAAGAAAVGGGAALIARGAWMQHDDCDQATCAEGYKESGSRWRLAAGAVLAAGGLGLISTGFYLHFHAERESASLGVGGRF